MLHGMALGQGRFVSSASRGRDLEKRLQGEAEKAGFITDRAMAVRRKVAGVGYVVQKHDLFGLFDLGLLAPGLRPVYIQVTSDPSDASRHRAEIGEKLGGGSPYGCIILVAMWSREKRAWRIWQRSSAAWILDARPFTTAELMASVKMLASPYLKTLQEFVESKTRRTGPPPPTAIMIQRRGRHGA